MSHSAHSSHTHSIDDRKKDRDDIASKIEEFLNNGGEITKCTAAFDAQQDPKCRLGHEMSFFV